jgi:hypothetical protein
MRKVSFKSFRNEETEPLSPPVDEAAAARNNTTMWSVDLTARQTFGISPRSKYIQKAEEGEGFDTPSSWQKEEEVERDGESDLKPDYNGRSSYSRAFIQHARQNPRKILIGTGLIAIFGAVITFGASKTIQTKSMAEVTTTETVSYVGPYVSGKSGKAVSKGYVMKSPKAAKSSRYSGMGLESLESLEFMTEEPTVSHAPSQSSQPSNEPSVSSQPSVSSAPSDEPTLSSSPSSEPSAAPSNEPSVSSKPSLSSKPSDEPTAGPSDSPSVSTKPTISASPTSNPSSSPTPKPTNPPSVPPTAAPTSVVTKVVPIEEEGMETIETEEETCIEDGWPCSNESGVCFNECCSGNKGEGKGWFACPGENGNRYCGDIEVYESTHCVHN